MADRMSLIWSRVAALFPVSEQLCRECGRAVRSLESICPSCGIRNPVKIPRWIGTVLLFLLVLPLFR